MLQPKHEWLIIMSYIPPLDHYTQPLLKSELLYLDKLDNNIHISISYHFTCHES